MAEIINLRRVRKTKVRTEAKKKADANRTKHGVARAARGLEEKRRQKTLKDLEAKRLEKDTGA